MEMNYGFRARGKALDFHDNELMYGDHFHPELRLYKSFRRRCSARTINYGMYRQLTFHQYEHEAQFNFCAYGS